MTRLKTSFLGVALLALWGCGPQITEARMAYAPARPDNCDIKVVNVRFETLGPTNTEYELLAQVIVQSSKNMDPFSEEMLSELRPRFCKLGGEEVTLGMSTNVAGGGSGTSYAVLKRKGAAAEAAPAPEASESPAP